MRKEPFGVGDYVHVYNRGNRKTDIVRDLQDRWRFLACLRFFNDEQPGQYTIRSFFGRCENNQQQGRVKSDFTRFGWPEGIPPQKPIVNIVSYCLMPNHFHLLLKEIVAGGITAFMRKLGTGFTNYSNIRYKESGRIFQGAYKAKCVTDKQGMNYIDAYIQILNPFESLPDRMPFNNFDKAFQAAIDDPFCSLGESLGFRDLSILDRKETTQKFHLPKNEHECKKIAREIILDKGFKKLLGDLTLED